MKLYELIAKLRTTLAAQDNLSQRSSGIKSQLQRTGAIIWSQHLLDSSKQPQTEPDMWKSLAIQYWWHLLDTRPDGMTQEDVEISPLIRQIALGDWQGALASFQPKSSGTAPASPPGDAALPAGGFSLEIGGDSAPVPAHVPVSGPPSEDAPVLQMSPVPPEPDTNSHIKALAALRKHLIGLMKDFISNHPGYSFFLGINPAQDDLLAQNIASLLKRKNAQDETLQLEEFWQWLAQQALRHASQQENREEFSQSPNGKILAQIGLRGCKEPLVEAPPGVWLKNAKKVIFEYCLSHGIAKGFIDAIGADPSVTINGNKLTNGVTEVPQIDRYIKEVTLKEWRAHLDDDPDVLDLSNQFLLFRAIVSSHANLSNPAFREALSKLVKDTLASWKADIANLGSNQKDIHKQINFLVGLERLYHESEDADFKEDIKNLILDTLVTWQEQILNNQDQTRLPLEALLLRHVDEWYLLISETDFRTALQQFINVASQKDALVIYLQGERDYNEFLASLTSIRAAIDDYTLSSNVSADRRSEAQSMRSDLEGIQAQFPKDLVAHPENGYQAFVAIRQTLQRHQQAAEQEDSKHRFRNMMGSRFAGLTETQTKLTYEKSDRSLFAHQRKLEIDVNCIKTDIKTCRTNTFFTGQNDKAKARALRENMNKLLQQDGLVQSVEQKEASLLALLLKEKRALKLRDKEIDFFSLDFKSDTHIIPRFLRRRAAVYTFRDVIENAIMTINSRYEESRDKNPIFTRAIEAVRAEHKASKSGNIAIRTLLPHSRTM